MYWNPRIRKKWQYFCHIVRATRLQKQLMEGKMEGTRRGEDRGNRGSERCDHWWGRACRSATEQKDRRCPSRGGGQQVTDDVLVVGILLSRHRMVCVVFVNWGFTKLYEVVPNFQKKMLRNTWPLTSVVCYIKWNQSHFPQHVYYRVGRCRQPV